jgi:hypothetical protein
VSTGGSSIHFINTIVANVTFSGTLSNTTTLIYMSGTSNIEVVNSSFTGVSSYAGTGGIFSDVNSSVPRTIIVKINGSSFTGI